MYTLFMISEKGPRSNCTIYEHVSDNSKKFLSIGNSGILSVVVCFLAPAYISLKYLRKVIYVIVVDQNGAGFLSFETVSLGRSTTLPYVRKIHHKIERHLRFVAHILTKRSQNVCLINIYIFNVSTCQM